MRSVTQADYRFIHSIGLVFGFCGDILKQILNLILPNCERSKRFAMNKDKRFAIYKNPPRRPRGPMDKASDYESGDSRFESWRGRVFFGLLVLLFFFDLVALFKVQTVVSFPKVIIRSKKKKQGKGQVVFLAVFCIWGNRILPTPVYRVKNIPK